jgi:glutamate synthase (NADPH/NADH) small chain
VAGEPVNCEGSILATEKRVVVLGGGDTGSDCVGTSHRQQAKEVYNFELLEKPPENRTVDTPWPVHPLPAQLLQTSSSHEEGGIRDWGISTKSFSGRNGKLEKLHAVRVRFGDVDPQTGRQKLEEVPGSEFTLDIDLVLLALGFLGPVRQGMVEELGIEVSPRGNVATQGFATNVSGVFSAGDMRRGQSLVVWAIAEGRQAAAEIDRYLRNGS